MRAASSFLLPLAVLLGACAAEPTNAAWPKTDPPLDRKPSHILRDAEPSEPLPGPERPLVYSSFSIDYAELAVAPPLREAPTGTTFSVTRVGNACGLNVDNGLFSEVQIGPYRLHSKGSVSGGLGPRHCLFDGRVLPAWLEGFGREAWTDDQLDYVQSTATLDTKTGKGATTALAMVTARALVPRALYAFRKCTKLCDEAGHREEQLVLVGPPAQWVTATVTAEEARDPHVGVFTTIALPVHRGSSASAQMTIRWRNLVSFLNLRGSERWTIGNAPEDAVVFSVEVAWLADADAPSILGFVSAGPSRPPKPPIKRKRTTPQNRRVELDGVDYREGDL